MRLDSLVTYWSRGGERICHYIVSARPNSRDCVAIEYRVDGAQAGQVVLELADERNRPLGWSELKAICGRRRLCLGDPIDLDNFGFVRVIRRKKYSGCPLPNLEDTVVIMKQFIIEKGHDLCRYPPRGCDSLIVSFSGGHSQVYVESVAVRVGPLSGFDLFGPDDESEADERPSYAMRPAREIDYKYLRGVVDILQSHS